MATVMISDLAGKTPLTTDEIEIQATAGGDSNKATLAQVKTLMSASPTLVTPVLGVATATTVNKMAITAPATGSTLAVADGKTATISNTLTLTGTDGSTAAFGSGGTVAYANATAAISAGTDLARATHGNRRLIVDTAVTLVVLDDTAGGWGSGDVIYGRNTSAGNVVLAADSTGTTNTVTALTGMTLTVPAGYEFALSRDAANAWVGGAVIPLVGKLLVPVMAAGITPSATGGCAALATIASAANQPDIQTLDFDTTTQEYAQFSIAMPESWNEGTVTFSPIWSHAATDTNFGVVWSLQALAVSNDDAIAQAFGTAVTSTDTGGTTNDVYVGPESAAITVAGTPAAGDTVFFRVSRVTGDGGDTMAIDARLHGIRLYYTSSALTDV